MSENELLAWAAGRLTGERVHALDAHVDGCEHCQTLLAEALRDSAELRPEPARAGSTRGNAFAAGELVAERYRVVRFVARGGMGEVYEVEDQWLRQTVALKTLLPAIADDESALARLKAEVLLARRIAHPNVCRVFDLGFAELPRARGIGKEERIAFLTMEFLSGETLSAYLRRSGALSVATARPMVEQMLAGLSHAHAAGIVHRDFKSDNVMLVSAGEGRELRVVVTDFGLARSLLLAGQSLTSSGHHALGTLDYMAPEQIQGKPATEQSDVYAIGIVLFEMLTGRLPFDGDSAVARALRRSQSPAPRVRELAPEVGSGWEQAIACCLERNPSARFVGLEQLSALLTASDAHVGADRRSRFWFEAAAAAICGVALAYLVSRLTSPAAAGSNVASTSSARESAPRLAGPALAPPAALVSASPSVATTSSVGAPERRQSPPSASSSAPRTSSHRVAPSPRPDANRLLDPFAAP